MLGLLLNLLVFFNVAVVVEFVSVFINVGVVVVEFVSVFQCWGCC